jgi:thiol:disulfide interchange protein DsbC
MKVALKYLVAVLLLVTAAIAHGDSNASIEAHLAKILGLKVEDISPGPIPGLYRLTIGPQIGYATADGHFFIRGEIIDMRSGENLTVRQRDKARLDYLQQLGTADMIVFAPAHPKYTITVLTDIDCGYCRVLDHDRPSLNAMGIAVRYMFFPRDGMGSSSWKKATDVWCAKDRKSALETAMAGKPVKSAACDTAGLKAGYQFGELLGLDGTPAIITDRGRLISGYVPPSELVSILGSGSK